MDMSSPDVVRDELIKSNPQFRDLVHQHQSYEERLSELAHLSYPSDDEQIEENRREAIEWYVFVRDACLQDREGDVNDGAEPTAEEEEDLYDFEE